MSKVTVQIMHGYHTKEVEEKDIKKGFLIHYNFFFFNEDIKNIIDKEREYNIDYMENDLRSYLNETGLEYFSPGTNENCGDYTAYTKEDIDELLKKYKYCIDSFVMVVKDSKSILNEMREVNYIERYDKRTDTIDQIEVSYFK